MLPRPEPDDAISVARQPVMVPAELVNSTIRSLNPMDEFLRCHPSATTRAEHGAFVAAQGGDPALAAEVAVEGIGINALSLAHARDALGSLPP